MGLIPELPESFKMKSFWERKEGATGVFVLAALGIGALYGLHWVLPILVAILQNTLLAGLLLGAIGCLVYVVTSKRFRTLASYMFKSAMRAITGIFVSIDPIGIMKNYVADLKNKEAQLDSQIGRLRGTMRQLQETISANQRERNKAMQMMSQAKKAGDQRTLILKSRKVGRSEQAEITYQQLSSKTEMIHRILAKMRETAVILIEDIEDEVKQQDLQRKAIRSANSAFKSAMKIITGDTEQKELYDQAMEFLAEDYAMKLGEIEAFMDLSKDFIKSIDLENNMYGEDALAKLESWEKRSDSLLLGGQKSALIAQSQNPAMELDLNEPLPDREDIIRDRQVEKGQDYSKLFEKQ